MHFGICMLYSRYRTAPQRRSLMLRYSLDHLPHPLHASLILYLTNLVILKYSSLFFPPWLSKQSVLLHCFQDKMTFFCSPWADLCLLSLVALLFILMSFYIGLLTISWMSWDLSFMPLYIYEFLWEQPSFPFTPLVSQLANFDLPLRTKLWYFFLQLCEMMALRCAPIAPYVHLCHNAYHMIFFN